MSGTRRKELRRIAIIGGGPAGIVTAKHLKAENCFKAIDIFEQQSSAGGVWKYSPDIPWGIIDIPLTDPNQPPEEPIWKATNAKRVLNGKVSHEPSFVSPMYDRLETNIPKNLMQHSDKPFPNDEQLFPGHTSVFEYLDEYAFDVRKLVQFQTQVLDVVRMSSEHEDEWLVRSKDLMSGKIVETMYDAIAVTNGHYSVPSIPDIKGIKDWNILYPGAISHSKLYKRSDLFSNKKVLIVGNSASGVDIAAHIGTVSKHPVLISERSPSIYSQGKSSWKKAMPQIEEFLPSSNPPRAIRFSDGHVEAEIDAVVFCTGYFYSYPFLSSLQPRLIDTGDRVQHLYKHLFYINDPTLAFVGLPSRILPFRTFEGQAAVITRVWANSLCLPSKSQMEAWEKSRITEKGDGRQFHVLPFPEDIDYHNSLVDWASKADYSRGKLPPRWSEKDRWARERFPEIKKAFSERGEMRSQVKSIEELGFDYEAWLRARQRENKI